jgi:hypothetical protein
MANLDNPYGFRPVQSRTVSEYTGKTRAVIIAKSNVSAFFNGDMVVFTGNSIKSEIDGKYYEEVSLAVGGAAQASENLAGAITGIEAHQDGSLLYTGYKPAGATENNIIVEIPQDRNTVYVVQEDSDGGALTAANTGQNINFNRGTGSAATRTSGATIDSSTAAVTETHQLRLLSPAGGIENEIGEFAQWYVTINTDPYSTRGGIA